MAINKGEQVELQAKLMMIYWRDKKLNDIKMVGYGETEYLSHKLSLPEIKNLNIDQLIDLSIKCGVKKARAAEKADIYINKIGYSLKSSTAALPALINHTHRAGIAKVCEREKIDIKRLDKLVNEYWQLREAGNIREDVPFKGSVFEKDRAVMIELLAYFLFKGTAQGDSLHPASGLYRISDPFDYKCWELYNAKDASESIIDKTIVSIRSKAMPRTYNETSNHVNHITMRPWVRYSSGAHRGSLHIRG